MPIHDSKLEPPSEKNKGGTIFHTLNAMNGFDCQENQFSHTLSSQRGFPHGPFKLDCIHNHL